MGVWNGRLDEGRYSPSWIYRIFKPGISGNDINGLGEKELRRPTPILWHRLKFIRHRLSQLLFQSRFRPRILLTESAMARQFVGLKKKKKSLKQTLPNSNQVRFQTPPTKELKNYCIEQGADTVGITKMQAHWIFQGYELPPWAVTAMENDELYLVIMAVQHEKESFQSAPSWSFSREIANRYNYGSEVAIKVAHWILDKGYHAYGHGGPEAGEFLITPAAIEAGIGELGKHGSLINPKLGGNFRIACVYTTLKLEPDSSAEFGIDDFCTRCQICTRECPPGAINDVKKLVRGEEKFYVDFDKCFPYMTDNYGCGICLKVCPWSNENIVEKVFQKQQKRVQKVSDVSLLQYASVNDTVYSPSPAGH